MSADKLYNYNFYNTYLELLYLSLKKMSNFVFKVKKAFYWLFHSFKLTFLEIYCMSTVEEALNHSSNDQTDSSSPEKPKVKSIDDFIEISLYTLLICVTCELNISLQVCTMMLMVHAGRYTILHLMLTSKVSFD